MIGGVPLSKLVRDRQQRRDDRLGMPNAALATRYQLGKLVGYVVSTKMNKSVSPTPSTPKPRQAAPLTLCALFAVADHRQHPVALQAPEI